VLAALVAEVLVVELVVLELQVKETLEEVHLHQVTQQVVAVAVLVELVNQVLVFLMELAQMVAQELHLVFQAHL
jgi:hypothetical protein